MTAKVRRFVPRSKHQIRVSPRVHGMMSRKDNFRNEHSNHAGRIPDSEWEAQKDKIITKYRQSTLNDTMKYMEDNFGFKASRRQYVHRFSKWGITKYKATPLQAPNPASPHSSQTINFPARHFPLNSRERGVALHNLSEVLLYLGDVQYAFAIKAALYRDLSTGADNINDPERKRALRMYITDCIRIAQTEATAKAARHMLENGLLYEDWVEADNSWGSVLFRILASRTYDSENGESSLIQIVEIINKTTVEDGDEDQERLQRLTPRRYRFDILMYQMFSYALERYNEPTAVDEQPIKVSRLLKQFKESQPAVEESITKQLHPLLGRSDESSDWELLLRALDFCISKISHLSIDGLHLDNKSTRANGIFLPLWRALQKHPSWTDEETYTKFAISATELLSIAIGMIVEEAPKLPENPRDLSISLTPAEWAREGAQVIKELVETKDPVLIDKFLGKVYAMNVEIMLEDEDREPLDATEAEQLNILRREVAKGLGIDDLPDLEEGAIIPQPLTANWDPTTTDNTPQGDHLPQQMSSWTRGLQRAPMQKLEVNTAQWAATSRSRSQPYSPSATSSSQSPATNGNTNGQASDASEENEDRIHLD